MKAMTEAHLAVLRRHMVELIDIHFELAEDETSCPRLGERLRRALMETPRHLFVPPQLAAVAYQDTPLPIGFDKTVSQPFIGALMLELLGLEPGQSVLEVGTGLGYQAALMALMGVRVHSVEIVEEFAEAAQQQLGALGLDIAIRVGDGSRGWSEHAPFERILVTAAADALPPAVFEQLAPDGRLVMPIGDGDVQELSLVTRGMDGGPRIDPRMKVRFTQLETV